MNGENLQLVTDEPGGFEAQDFMKNANCFRAIYRVYIPQISYENPKDHNMYRNTIAGSSPDE